MIGLFLILVSPFITIYSVPTLFIGEKYNGNLLIAVMTI